MTILAKKPPVCRWSAFIIKDMKKPEIKTLKVPNVSKYKKAEFVDRFKKIVKIK